jgi:hypothetical protein
MQNSMKLGEQIYKNSQASQSNQSPETNASEAPKNDSSHEENGKVVDGEYEVKDDKNN